MDAVQICTTHIRGYFAVMDMNTVAMYTTLQRKYVLDVLLIANGAWKVTHVCPIIVLVATPMNQHQENAACVQIIAIAAIRLRLVWLQMDVPTRFHTYMAMN